MTNPIVTVNVSQLIPSQPSALQKKGAFLSTGGTTLATGKTSLITQMSDLTALLSPALAVTSVTWLAGVATVTTTAAHGVATAATFLTTIAGATQAGYNGTFLATVTGLSTFTYPLVTNPGTSPATGTITYTPRSVAELVAMGTEFFAQGLYQTVSVLELGAGEPEAAIAQLTTFIAAQPTQPFYAYLVPRNWDGVAAYLTLLASYETNTAKTYFFTTTTLSTYANYTKVMKGAPWLIEAPNLPPTEFSIAAWFYDVLNTTPSTTAKVTPSAFSYLFAVTQYPTVGNAPTITAIQAANGNIVGSGAEGNISNNVLFWGTTPDGQDFSYWYSVDWTQLNADLEISSAIIAGSNNPVNPLYLNQDGIDRLQAALTAMMNRGVSYGLVLGSVVQTALDQVTFLSNFNAGTYAGQAVVNAIPFNAYYKVTPSDFPIGKYAGFTIAFTPNRGFKQIIINVVVTQFVAA